MHVCRTKFKKQIITEFIPPADKKSQKVIIFCAGVPGHPDKDDVMEFWAKKGYWTFFPRYRGCWESSGLFLKESLEKDVLDVIDCFSEKFVDYWDEKTYRLKATDITILGSSFGGPAAILATRDPRVHKAVCISPVVDWQAENKAEPLDHLYKILKEGYGEAYRVNKANWNKLAKGKFYNPARHIDELEGKDIMIFHAVDDDVVKYKPVAEFAQKTGSHLVTLRGGGHLSSSLTMEYRHYWRIRAFLNS